MSPPGAEAWLLGRELFGIRPGLERIRALLDRLGRPQEAFDALHVVGSNGKTSTVTIAAALLERRGLATGAYVSPHLVGFGERVLVAGAPAPEPVFAGAVDRVREVAEAMERSGEVASAAEPVTQFEAVTAAAFLVLAEAGVRCAVVEAGLGGRWDATNVLPAGTRTGRPAVTILTSVALEHTRWLGHTFAEIAAEKVEVLRERGVLVLGPDLPDDARRVALDRARERGATVIDAPADLGVRTPGAAHYQRGNLAVAACAVDAYLGSTDGDAVGDVAGRLVVPGRLETVAGDPVVLHDGAHNPAGARALAAALDAAPPARPVVLLLGVLDDKDAGAILDALRRWADGVVAVAPSGARSLSSADLAATARRVLAGAEVEEAGDPHVGLDRARTLAGRRGTVLCTGSLHLIADLRRGPDAAPGSAF